MNDSNNDMNNDTNNDQSVDNKKTQQYKMTQQEFNDNINKILEKFHMAIQQRNKAEVIRNVDLLNIFVHCHLDDM